MPATRNRRKTPATALVVRQLAAPMPDETMAAPQDYNPVAQALAREYGAMPQALMEVPQPMDEPSYPALQEGYVEDRPSVYGRAMPELDEAMLSDRPQFAMPSGPDLAQYATQYAPQMNLRPKAPRFGDQVNDQGAILAPPVAVNGVGRRILRDSFGRPVSTGTGDIVEVKRYR